MCVPVDGPGLDRRKAKLLYEENSVSQNNTSMTSTGFHFKCFCPDSSFHREIKCTLLFLHHFRDKLKKGLCVYLLSQSDKGEDGHVISHTYDEDKPEREGEMFHICQLDHFP